jgi:hypothetical protein
MIIYIVIALVILSILYSVMGKKKPQGERGSSTEKSTASNANKALSGESLTQKQKFRIPDHGGVITISLQAVRVSKCTFVVMN